MFKKRRGIRLSYEKQGLICFICLDDPNQPQQIREKIDALFELLTSQKGVRSIVLRRRIAGEKISESRMYDLRKAFYEAWDDYDRKAREHAGKGAQ